MLPSFSQSVFVAMGWGLNALLGVLAAVLVYMVRFLWCINKFCFGWILSKNTRVSLHDAADLGTKAFCCSSCSLAHLILASQANDTAVFREIHPHGKCRHVPGENGVHEMRRGIWIARCSVFV
jgi:hypothetical protein